MHLKAHMTGLCKYSHSLGVPNKGSHSLRAGGFAAVDILLTIGLAGVITKYGLGKVTLSSFMTVFVILVIAAVCIHEAFCVRTRLNAIIFGRPWPDPADITDAK
jgi:hypothetical protein